MLFNGPKDSHKHRDNANQSYVEEERVSGSSLNRLGLSLDCVEIEYRGGFIPKATFDFQYHDPAQVTLVEAASLSVT